MRRYLRALFATVTVLFLMTAALSGFSLWETNHGTWHEAVPGSTVAKEIRDTLLLFFVAIGILCGTVVVLLLQLKKRIREQDTAHRTLLELREQLENAQALSKIGSFEVCAKTRATTLSRQAFRNLGMEPVADASLAFIERVHPEDWARVEQSFTNAVQNGSSYVCDYRIVTPDGAVRHMHGIVEPVLDVNGQATRFFGTFQDVTEALERDLKLIQASKMASLGEMASGIAHEINNPLTIIGGTMSQLGRQLDRGTLAPDRVREAIEKIDGVVQRISEIIKGLAFFAREGSRDPLVVASAADILTKTLELCSQKFERSGVELQVELAKDDLVFACRPVQVSQVLLNLLSNAYHAARSTDSANGKPFVRVEVALEDETNVAFRVMDSGPGVAEEMRHKIMQPFFTTKELGHGTGLGLSISQGIVQTHQGRLELSTSSPLTCFVASFPGAAIAIGLRADETQDRGLQSSAPGRSRVTSIRAAR